MIEVIDKEELKQETIEIVDEIDRRLAEISKASELTIYDTVLTKKDDLLKEMLSNPEILANINAADKKGFTPMDYAASSKNCYAVELLLQNGASYTKKMIYDSLNTKRIEVLETFFSNGVNINMSLVNDDFENDAENFEETPVMQALSLDRNKNMDVVMTLLKFSPDLSGSYDAKDGNPNGHNILYKISRTYFDENSECTKDELFYAAIKTGADPSYNDYEFLREMLQSDYFEDKVFLETYINKEQNLNIFYKNDLFLGKEDLTYEEMRWEKKLLEKLLAGKIMTATQNLNIRKFRYEYDYNYSDDPIICTLLSGSKVKVTNVLEKEKIDGMNKFWVVVEVLDDSLTVEGEPVEENLMGYCYSGYLK